MYKALQQSVKALRANPARTFLTTLGIIIGISTVILVLSAGAGFRSLINQQVGAFGSNTLFIQTKVPPTTKSLASASAGGLGGGSDMGGVVITTLNQRDLDNVKQLGNVSGDYGMVIGQSVISYGDIDKSVLYYGSGAAKFSIDEHTLQSGRLYTQAEDDGAAQVVILGSQLATDLFPQGNALGNLVKIGTLNFQIIGVYAPQGFAGGGTADDSAYMPLGTAQKKMLGINYLAIAVVQLENPNLGAATAASITEVLQRDHNITDPAKDDFSVETEAQALSTFNIIFNGLTALLIAIAAISLIVGGVGIMNIMYVVVTERTAEIGLKKALGAKNKDILNEFLIESILVTVIGGIFGVLLGGLLGWLVSIIATHAGLTWVFSVPLYAIALAVGVSAVIGIGFGVLPARSAAKMDPIEALRYE